MHRVVVCDGHVHLHQALRGMEAKEDRPMNQKQQMKTRGKDLSLQVIDLSTWDESVFQVVSIKQILSQNKLVYIHFIL